MSFPPSCLSSALPRTFSPKASPVCLLRCRTSVILQCVGARARLWHQQQDPSQSASRHPRLPRAWGSSGLAFSRSLPRAAPVWAVLLSLGHLFPGPACYPGSSGFHSTRWKSTVVVFYSEIWSSRKPFGHMPFKK